MTSAAAARTRSTSLPAMIAIAEPDHDWQATIDEAVARIDTALTTISAHADAVDSSAARGHLAGQLAAALTILEQAANRLAAPAPSDDEHPF